MKIEIELPDEIVSELEKESKELGFESVEDFVIYILTEYSSETKESNNSEEMKARLKALGYLDE